VQRVSDQIPWKVTDISLRPYAHFWSFNPSIHFDGQLWRCSLRCADYCMRDGVTHRSPRARAGESWTKNVMVIFDPNSWTAVEIYKMRERDGLPRVSCASMGYEDIRIFRTDKGGLQGIAASLHLWRGDHAPKRFAEQVLLSFDAEYNVTHARPIRGTSWGNLPQKNWVPFDGCVEPLFLYSISEGQLFDERGPLVSKGMQVRSSALTYASLPEPSERARKRARKRAIENALARSDEEPRRNRADKDRNGRDIDLSPAQLTCEDLRGGTQLVHIGTEGWLGIGHKMKFVNRKKLYWHIWYLVDDYGKMTAASPPMKLAPNSIEFAAGMGVEGDRVVVSFGVDDVECKIGETRLSAVLETLRAVGS
jgi:hypothetical protein